MSNDIVKYHNNLSQVGLKNFTRSELNLFMVLCSKCQNKSTSLVELSFKDLREMANYEGKNDKRLADDIRRTNKKLLELNLMIRDEKDPGTTEQFALFSKFTTMEKEKKLQVRVNEEFSYILNELTHNFTRFDLEEFVELKSIYSKNLYRQLKKYRTTGWWKVNLEEFKRLIDIPESYNVSKINAKILKPITEELPQYFEDFRVEKTYGKGPGKPIIGYEFYFKPEKRNPAYKPTGRFCRECGQELYEMKLNGKICWAHPGGGKDDSICNVVYNSIADIEGYDETPTRKTEYDNTIENEEFPTTSPNDNAEYDDGEQMTVEELHEKLKETMEKMSI